MVVRYLIFSLFSLVFSFNLAYGKTIYGKALKPGKKKLGMKKILKINLKL